MGICFAQPHLHAQGIFHPHIVFNTNGVGSVSGSWTTDDPSFIFTPSASGTATFTHGYTDSAATMKLYNYSTGTLLKTESNSDGNNTMTYSVTAGTEYRLWLDMPLLTANFSITNDLPNPPISTISLNLSGDATNSNQNISPSSEGEYWKYTAPAAGSLSVIADSVGGVGWDTDLFVFNSSGTLIYSDTGGANDGDYSTTVTAGQVLIFLIRGDVGDEGSDSTGRYDLYFTGPAPPEITVLFGSTGITDGQSTAIDFGSVVQGQTGITKVFTVRNDGGATLTLGNVSVRLLRIDGRGIGRTMQSQAHEPNACQNPSQIRRGL